VVGPLGRGRALAVSGTAPRAPVWGCACASSRGQGRALAPPGQGPCLVLCRMAGSYPCTCWGCIARWASEGSAGEGEDTVASHAHRTHDFGSALWLSAGFCPTMSTKFRPLIVRFRRIAPGIVPANQSLYKLEKQFGQESFQSTNPTETNKT
jgi:hypothetical protein